MSGLKCRLCGKLYPKEALNFCTDDFGPLEVAYDYEEVARTLTRAAIAARPRSMWRYRELLPLDGEPTVGRHVGCTPLIRADRLARALGVVRALYQERRRQLSHALVQGPRRGGGALEGRRARLPDRRLRLDGQPRQQRGGQRRGRRASKPTCSIPDGLEQGKVLGATIYGAKVIAIEGNYDQVNRLCSQIAFRFGWGFVNVNLRPFYAEGSKIVGFEIAEDLGWRAPDHVVAPMAGGSLIGKIHKAFKEFERLGLIDGPVTTRMHGAQATGCNPISATVKTGASKVKPVRNPQTIAKSLAIGDPADGYFASQLIRDTGGWSEDVDDDAIIDAMRLLAETEGIWTETAGGVTLAVAQKLIEQGRIDRDDSIVVCITGNGLKTQEALLERMPKPVVIKPTLEEFEAVLETLVARTGAGSVTSRASRCQQAGLSPTD